MPLSCITRSATRNSATRFSFLLKVNAPCRAVPNLLLPTTTTRSSVFGQSSSPLRPFHTTTPAFKKKMPPKKKVVEEKKVILGRPGNNLKVSFDAGCPLFGLVAWSHADPG